MPRVKRMTRLTIAQEEEVSEHAWRLSLQGHSPRQIVKQLNVSLPIIERVLNETQQAVRERLHRTAATDLTRVLEGLRLARVHYAEIHYHALRRVAEEEQREQVENDARAERGLLPKTRTPQALKMYVAEMRTALNAIRGMIATTVLEAKYNGLEQFAKELARRNFVSEAQEYLRLLSTPMEIIVRVAQPVPHDWDDGPENDYCEFGVPGTGCPGHVQYCCPPVSDPVLDEFRETKLLPTAP